MDARGVPPLRTPRYVLVEGRAKKRSFFYTAICLCERWQVGSLYLGTPSESLFFTLQFDSKINSLCSVVHGKRLLWNLHTFNLSAAIWSPHNAAADHNLKNNQMISMKLAEKKDTPLCNALAKCHSYSSVMYTSPSTNVKAMRRQKTSICLHLENS